jgi:hypothetical protein
LRNGSGQGRVRKIFGGTTADAAQTRSAATEPWGSQQPLAGVPKDTIFGMPLTDPAAPVFLVLPVGGKVVWILMKE